MHTARIFLFHIFTMAACCFVPTLGMAVVAMQTEIASGVITEKSENHSIKLDNGKIYQPSRDSLVIDLPVGASVTLMYTIGDMGKNVFFQFAPGLNSIKKPEPPISKKNQSPM